MARATCRVKIGELKPNRWGYIEVMNSGAVQGIVREHAEATRDAADAMLSADGYDSAQGHKTGAAQGALARGCYVRANTNHAKRSTLRHNTLRKALR